MNFAKIHTILTIWIPVLYLYCTKLSFFSFQEEVTILGKPENNVFQQYKKKMLMTYLNCSIYMLFYNKYCVTITSHPTHRNLSWVSRWYRKTLKTDKQTKNHEPKIFKKSWIIFIKKVSTSHSWGMTLQGQAGTLQVWAANTQDYICFYLQQ